MSVVGVQAFSVLSDGAWIGTRSVFFEAGSLSDLCANL